MVSKIYYICTISNKIRNNTRYPVTIDKNYLKDLILKAGFWFVRLFAEKKLTKLESPIRSDGAEVAMDIVLLPWSMLNVCVHVRVRV